MLNPMEFVRQVKSEMLKVVWPTRKEVLVTTAMVFVLVLLAAAFFFVVDRVFLVHLVHYVLGLGA